MCKSILRVLCLALVILLIPLGLMAQSAEQQQPAANDVAAPADTGASGLTAPANPAPAPAAQQPASTTARRTFAPTNPVRNPQASLYGYPGMWRAVGAGSMPVKSFGGIAFVDRINRNPGFLTVTTIGTSGFVSVIKRLAFDWQVNFNRRILVRRADQLSLGQQNLVSRNFGGCPFANCVANNMLPFVFYPAERGNQVLTRLRDPGRFPGITGTDNLLDTAGFYNDFPWAAARRNEGFGEIMLGGHINLRDFNDENKGFAVALRPHVAIPTRYSEQNLRDNGVQTGAVAYGADLLMQARPGSLFDIYMNAGYTHVTNPERGDNTLMGLYDYIPTVFGVTLPRNSRLQLMLEYTATFYQIGGGTRDAILNTATDGTGGFRLYLTDWLALSAGYRHTLNHSQYGGDKHGFVATLSATYVPPVVIPIVPPNVTCSAQPTSVRAGTPVTLTANATPSQPGYTLTYTWATTGGRIEGSGPTARLDTTGLAPNTYTVTVRVDDGHGGFADCTSMVTIEAPPPPPPAPKPPTVSCSIDRRTVNAGETVMLTATANSPDNRPLNYDWTTTGGKVQQPAGPTVRWDTTGLPAGTYTATARVTDDRGLSATCSSSLTISVPPPPPRAARLNACNFKERSPRVDNACKAVLDDVALRLQNEPDSRAAVIGSATTADTKRKADADMDVVRASNVKAYLVRDKGIAADRIDVRTRADSSTVEIWLIPRGANIADVPGATAAEKMPPEPKPAAKKPAAKKPAAKTP